MNLKKTGKILTLIAATTALAATIIKDKKMKANKEKEN